MVKSTGPSTPAALSVLLRSLPPSCGPVRLVAVDGHAGSGKTTFAARVAAELGGAPVLHLDDLATHETFFGWTGRLTRQVLAPLSEGRSARFTAYDWTRRCFPAGDEAAAEVRPEPVVLIEGVGAGRSALRPHLASVLWMDVPAQEAWRRGRRRDGPALADFWSSWTAAETDHFAKDPSYSYANYLVRQVVHQREQGFEVRVGPAGRR